MLSQVAFIIVILAGLGVALGFLFRERQARLHGQAAGKAHRSGGPHMDDRPPNLRVPGRPGRATLNSEPAHSVDTGTSFRPRRDSIGPKWNPYAEDQSLKHRKLAIRNDRAPVTGPNYYTVLGLEPTATDDQIERAYRKQVVKLHPDRYMADARARAIAEAELRRLNAIMVVLRDPLARAKYDSTLRA